MQTDKVFLWELFKALRLWNFPLSPQDYQSLHDALNAGFGWESLADLRFVCAAVWAKSRQEQDILSTVFDRLSKEFGWEDWRELTQASQSEQAESVAPGSREAKTALAKGSVYTFISSQVSLVTNNCYAN